MNTRAVLPAILLLAVACSSPESEKTSPDYIQYSGAHLVEGGLLINSHSRVEPGSNKVAVLGFSLERGVHPDDPGTPDYESLRNTAQIQKTDAGLIIVHNGITYDINHESRVFVLDLKGNLQWLEIPSDLIDVLFREGLNQSDFEDFIVAWIYPALSLKQPAWFKESSPAAADCQDAVFHPPKNSAIDIRNLTLKEPEEYRLKRIASSPDWKYRIGMQRYRIPVKRLEKSYFGGRVKKQYFEDMYKFTVRMEHSGKVITFGETPAFRGNLEEHLKVKFCADKIRVVLKDRRAPEGYFNFYVRYPERR